MGFDLSVGISAVTVFLQGLLSVFSPCVLPLIPLYIGYLAGGTAGGQPGGTNRPPPRPAPATSTRIRCSSRSGNVLSSEPQTYSVSGFDGALYQLITFRRGSAARSNVRTCDPARVNRPDTLVAATPVTRS